MKTHIRGKITRVIMSFCIIFNTVSRANYFFVLKSRGKIIKLKNGG
jgi:hypothetical protein